MKTLELLHQKTEKELGYKSLDELAEAIHKTKMEFSKLPGIKPVFRLHPPSKGFKGKVKRSLCSPLTWTTE